MKAWEICIMSFPGTFQLQFSHGQSLETHVILYHYIYQNRDLLLHENLLEVKVQRLMLVQTIQGTTRGKQGHT